MTGNYYAHVQRGLQLLRTGLTRYVERRLREKYDEAWWTGGAVPHLQRMEQLRNRLPQAADDRARLELLDNSALLTIINRQFNEIFVQDLGREGLGYVHELSAVRNHWAHEDPFTQEEAARALDTIVLLLRIINAPELKSAIRIREEIASTAGSRLFVQLGSSAAWQAATGAASTALLLAALSATFAVGLFLGHRATPTAAAAGAVATPAISAVPAAVPPQCTCKLPDLDCPDFRTHADAQVCFDYCAAQGLGDLYKLDGNNDGKACTSLP